MLWRLVKTLLFTAVMPGTVGLYLPQALKSGGTDLGVAWRYGGAALGVSGALVYFWCAWESVSIGTGNTCADRCAARVGDPWAVPVHPESHVCRRGLRDFWTSAVLWRQHCGDLWRRGAGAVHSVRILLRRTGIEAAVRCAVRRVLREGTALDFATAASVTTAAILHYQ
jgi:hypothetical protein